MRSDTAQKNNRKKQPQKKKNVLFPNKNVPIFVSLRGAQRRGNLKAEGMASRGEAREYETRRNPHYKKGIRRVVSLPLSLFQGSVSFRATIVRSGMANRFVKDCRVGREKCALLAMTQNW